MNILKNLRAALRTLTGNDAAHNVPGSTAFEMLLENFHDAVVMYDPNFTILSLNRAAETLFGVHREELVGIRVDPSWVEKPRYRLFIQTLFPSLAPSSMERSEGGARPQIVTLSFEDPRLELIATLHRMDDRHGNPTAFLKVVENETRTKEILSARSEFVGIAAHQLRTPLTAIRWSLESLEKEIPKGSEGENLLTETEALVDRALKIVNDFLDAAKIEEGKFGLSFETSDLVALLEALLSAAAPIAQRYGIALYFNHPDIPALRFSFDPSRLSTALLNFIDNAIRYNVRGGNVTVTLTKDIEGNQAILTIADTGIGIPKGEERKLFQKLERGSNAVQAEPNGSGLGLYIAKNIVEGHRGTITFDSEMNRGTTFTITFPLARQSV